MFRFEGQAAVFAAAGGPCYRCLHPEPPPAGLIANCAEAGVLGVLPGIVGTIQATEAIKLITGIGEPLVGRLLLYDALRMRVREISLPRDPECPVCGDAPTIRELVAYDQVCAAPEVAAEVRRGDWSRSRDDRRGTAPMANRRTAALLTRCARALRTCRQPHRGRDARSAPAVARRSSARIPKDQPVVVHCKSGGRSAIAVAILKVAGYDAHNLSGGIQAWEATRPQALTIKSS